MSLARALLGPLAGPEYRRAAGRPWPALVRMAVALLGAGLVLIVAWYSWLGRNVDPGHLPSTELRAGLMTLVFMALTAALVLVPAVLAGSLAGDKERGAMALLLTTTVSAREIVTGRLAGKLGQAGTILLAALPALAWIAGCCGIAPLNLLAMAGLPAAVACGAGGLAVGASAVSRRARDAVLGVFALESFFLILRVTDWARGVGAWVEWVGALDPFSGLRALTWDDNPAPALATMALWTAMGALGVAWASWRLRPACLGRTGREGEGRRRSRRRWRVPPMGERPMLWKELYIERVGALGWFGRLLGVLLVAYLAVGSSVWAGRIAWARWVSHNTTLERLGAGLMDSTIVRSAPYFAWLIEWAIGLRAAVSIASERERGTWDALMLSPLTGSEVVRGKLWGSLFALRWLIVAALWAWALATIVGELEPGSFALRLASVLIVGTFMAAVGVRVALNSTTATRAMTVTLGIWLVAGALSTIVAGLLFAISGLIWLMFWLVGSAYGVLAPNRAMWTPLTWEAIWAVLTLAPYAMAAAMIVAEARLRFDRVAGRQATGELYLTLPPEPPESVASPPHPSTAPTPEPDLLAEDDAILGPVKTSRPKTWRPGPRDWT